MDEPRFPWRSRDLRRALWEGAGEALIARLDCGWNDGLCGVLALALHRYFGPTSQLMVLGCQQHAVCHIVCLQQGHYVDGDGISTARQLLNRWQRLERQPAPFLRPYDPLLVAAARIILDEALVAEVLAILQAIPRRREHA